MRARIGYLVAVAIGCSGSPAAPVKPLSPSSPRLSAPQPIDPSTRGAAYLEALGQQIQPRWEQFLEDCRLRLPFEHPLNTPALVATVELVIGSTGHLVERHTIQGSGNGDFDGAMSEVLGDVSPGVPPADLESDDGLVHVRWVFARDRRQAGAATAEVMRLELPLVVAVQRLLERGELSRGATRVAVAPVDDDQRPHAIELVMVGALREALGSSDGYTRVAALEAVAEIHRSPAPRSVPMTDLTPAVHRLIGSSGQTERVQAMALAASLGDRAAVPELVDGLALELEQRPEIALAKLAALAVLEQRAEVTSALARIFATSEVDRAMAVAALAIAPDPARARHLVKWFAAGPPQMRETICAALPAAAPAFAADLVGAGLRSADATVRATCVAATTRLGAARDVAFGIVRRLGELTRDRDQVVRARAVAALGAIDPARRERLARHAIGDRAPQVRAAFAVGASEPELRLLAGDKDPDVRAAALGALGERGFELAAGAIADPASQVRRAAVAGLVADEPLLVLAGDADPDVATAALVRYAMRRGRASVAAELLVRLVAATPKSMERVRIARAYLLAGP